jgi:hypothetical protein
LRREVIAFLLISFVIILISGVSALTPLPSFCNTCHGRDYQAWKESPHREVNCDFCHQQSGLLGLGVQRVKVLRMFASQATGLYGRPVTAQVEREQCRLCHLDVESKVIVRNALRVSHDEFTKEGWQCTECHNTIAHKGVTPNEEFGTMEKCLECHNLERASTQCDLCHIENVERERRVTKDVWRVTHGPAWRSLHGMGNLSSCSVCHSENYCAKCHKIALPHTEAWMANHGGIAKQVPDSCTQCHQQNLCKSCHQIEMPHPATFLPEHPKIEKQRGEAFCLKCHMKASCDLCHARHIHRAVWGFDGKKRLGVGQ